MKKKFNKAVYVTPETHEMLMQLGVKGQTFDEIINMLIRSWIDGENEHKK